MTAIISYITPKQAALAVDSALTITDEYGKKRFEYNYNKLYELIGKKIAVIQYNNPWFINAEIKSIIPAFIKHSNKIRYQTLQECYLDFITFLETSNLVDLSEDKNQPPMGLIFVGFGDTQQYLSFFKLELFSVMNKKIGFDLKASHILNQHSDSFILFTGDSIGYAIDFINGIDEILRNQISGTNSNKVESDNLIQAYCNKVHSGLACLKIEEQSNFCRLLVNVINVRQMVNQQDVTVGGPVDVAYIKYSEGFKWLIRKPVNTLKSKKPRFVNKHSVSSNSKNEK